MIDLKEITIEKFSLFIVVLFVVFLFTDYSFDFVNKLQTEYEINKLTRLKNTITDKKVKDIIDLKLEKHIAPSSVYKRKKITMILLISIFPLLFFVGKTAFQKKNDNNDALTVIATVYPFIIFIISFYSLKLEFVSTYYIGVFVLMLLQLICLLLLDSLINTLLLKWCHYFNSKNKTWKANLAKSGKIPPQKEA